MDILFVDDDQGFLDQAEFVLEENDPDFNVIPLLSADKALEYLEENDADIIVSDYRMPEMDGLEFLEELRDRGDDIPFIIFTGKGREEIAMKALNLGADRYFKKGGDPKAQYDVLGQAIKQEVHHWRTMEEHERMEEELKESERRYRAIFENIGLAMLAIEEDNEISLVNREFEELSGYGKEEIEGKKKWLQFVAEDDRERVKKFLDLKNIDRSLAPSSYEFRFIDKHGDEKFVFASSSTLPSSKKSVISLFDFTLFKEALQELKTIEEAFKQGDLRDSEFDIISSTSELFTPESIKSSIKDWCLEELLILLIRDRDGATGKELMSDLNNLFDIELSSSIVYPKLHKLEEEGILSVQEQIRSKKYIIEDVDTAAGLVTSKLKQLFGIYSILKLLRSRWESS